MADLLKKENKALITLNGLRKVFTDKRSLKWFLEYESFYFFILSFNTYFTQKVYIL